MRLPILAAAALVIAAPATATVFTLALSGTPASGSYSSFTSGTTHYDQYYLSLAGLDASDAITVAQGDEIDATITLDSLLTIPASQTFTAFGVYLTGAAFPPTDTGVTGTTAFFAGGAPVRSSGARTTTSGQLVNSVVYSPPANTAFAFDSVASTFVIDTLAAPVALDRSFLSYTLASTAAVPEPASWALLVVGFGAIGVQVRRRRPMLAASIGD